MSRNKLIEFEPNTIKVEFTPDGEAFSLDFARVVTFKEEKSC